MCHQEVDGFASSTRCALDHGLCAAGALVYESIRDITASSVNSIEQARVFDEIPAACRKIILSTNIAETSITIPDVQLVVDTGRLREKRYDQLRRINKLQCMRVTKSNAKQCAGPAGPAGPAGRVQNNSTVLYTPPGPLMPYARFGLPEMLRSDLQEICLDIKAQKFSAPIRGFLAAAIEPPATTAVDTSVINMQAL